MTCVDNRIVAPRAVLGDDVVAQQTHADRVQAAERLVENEQIGLMNHRGDELHALQHAFRQVLAQLPLGAGQSSCSSIRGTRAAASSRLTPFSCAM